MKNFTASVLISLSALLFIFTSCTDDEDHDFRDGFIGSYKCIETFYYFDPINDTIMNWSTDTISLDVEITVEKYEDNSLNIKYAGNSMFIATYEGNNKFTCLDCNGPSDYAQFLEKDSLYIYTKHGVTNSIKYYGKKQ